MSEPLSIFTVYDRPRDFPDKIVVRRFEYDQPTNDCYVFESLGKAREALASRGLVCLTRHPDDDPVIVETWM